MSKQLNINPEMDALARKKGLGHWSCVSPLNNRLWVRSDGVNFVYSFGECPFEMIKLFDDTNPVGEDWQQPETEEEFLNRKLPCDIKIGSGVNKAGTSIKTLLLRANSIIGSQDIVVDKEKQARAKKLLLDLIKAIDEEIDEDDFESPQQPSPITSHSLSEKIDEMNDWLSNALVAPIDEKDKAMLDNQFNALVRRVRSYLGISITSGVSLAHFGIMPEDAKDAFHDTNIFPFKSVKQPALVQKPFQYPCDGALYFTKKDRTQVYVYDGLVPRRATMDVGIDSICMCNSWFLGNASVQIIVNQEGKHIEYYDGNYVFGNPDNDLIMMTWN